MASTLHEMAVKLQEFIIQQQSDAHSSSGLNINKYNNIKLRMDGMIDYPHVIISIGISEALYNIKDVTKVDGGLGSDEKYIWKWLNKSNVVENLVELYKSLSDMTTVEDEIKENENMMAPEAEGSASTVRSSRYDQQNRLRRLMLGLEELETEDPNAIKDAEDIDEGVNDTDTDVDTDTDTDEETDVETDEDVDEIDNDSEN